MADSDPDSDLFNFLCGSFNVVLKKKCKKRSSTRHCEKFSGFTGLVDHHDFRFGLGGSWQKSFEHPWSMPLLFIYRYTKFVSLYFQRKL